MDTLAADIPRIDVEAYRAQGFVLVRGVFDRQTIARMRAEADAMLERVAAAGKNVEAMWQGSWRGQLLGKRESGDSIASGRVAEMAATVSSIHDVQYHSAYFMRVITDARLTGAVAQLIGDNVQLHHTKYHVKPPAFGAPFPMHQDYPYFPHESHTMLAAAIHIDAADVENGCLCVVPGSNQLGPLRHQTDGHHFLPLASGPSNARPRARRTRAMCSCSTISPCTAPMSIAARARAGCSWCRCDRRSIAPPQTSISRPGKARCCAASTRAG